MMNDFEWACNNSKNSNLIYTDLLESDDAIARMAHSTSGIVVLVRETMSAEETQLFYRNLIRLTIIYRKNQDDIEFRLIGSTTRIKALKENLESKGYPNITVIKDAATSETVSEPRSEYGIEELTFKEFCIAGIGHHLKTDDDIWEVIRIGQRVTLIPEPDNEHDGDAIAVMYFDDTLSKAKKLGYVPRICNTEISTLLKAGWCEIFNAFICDYNPDASLNARIKVKVTIVHK